MGVACIGVPIFQDCETCNEIMIGTEVKARDNQPSSASSYPPGFLGSLMSSAWTRWNEVIDGSTAPANNNTNATIPPAQTSEQMSHPLKQSPPITPDFIANALFENF